MLRFTNFKKSYGRVAVLEIPDFQLDAGSYWIRGANGSGKSTLLKSAAGILYFEGDILLDGISIKKKPQAYRRIVNFADAEPVFPDFLTGMELVRLFASAKKAPKGQETGYIESMKMSSYIDQPIGTYSSGMLKKLSLVLAFLGRPKVILLDEPFITLDLDSLQRLYDWISAAHRTGGVSFLLSSHQPFEAGQQKLTRIVEVENRTIRFEP